MIEILIKIAAVLALVAALFFGEQYIESRGYDRARAEDQVAADKSKREAAATLANETAKTHSAEQELQDLKNTQELQDATHQKTVADLSSRLRNLAGANGRLRDPHAAGCGPGGDRPTSEAAPATGGSPADPAQAGGLVSAELTQFLFEQAASADAINIAYSSCRADAYSVRGTAPKDN